MSTNLTKAIQLLSPNSEFTISNDDYSTIEWNALKGKAPTQSEIDAATETIKTNEAKAEADKLAAKQSAQAKLAALGLTADEVTAIIGA